MNWGRTLAYLGTHAGAALSLLAAGYYFDDGNLFLAFIGCLAALFCWLIWKWNEER